MSRQALQVTISSDRPLADTFARWAEHHHGIRPDYRRERPNPGSRWPLLQLQYKGAEAVAAAERNVGIVLRGLADTDLGRPDDWTGGAIGPLVMWHSDGSQQLREAIHRVSPADWRLPWFAVSRGPETRAAAAFAVACRDAAARGRIGRALCGQPPDPADEEEEEVTITLGGPIAPGEPGLVVTGPPSGLVDVVADGPDGLDLTEHFRIVRDRPPPSALERQFTDDGVAGCGTDDLRRAASLADLIRKINRGG